jgi:glycosyltransferase involved in cell wall biosynthesis
LKHKLLIDSISLLSSHTGIGRYTYNIANELKNQDNFDIEYFYGYYSKKLINNSSKVSNLKSIVVKNSYIKKIARKLLMLLSKIIAPHYDIYWQPNFIPNNFIKAKKIVTSVHDFSFILYKDFHPKERIEYFENNFFKNIYKSDMIITGSNFSKQEIIDRLGFEASKIEVIYHGIDHKLFKVYDDLDINIDLPKRFIFCVGSIEPRKNLLGLLKAYNLLDKNIKEKYKLVLAGFKGWENKEIMQLIKQNEDYIKYLGYISDKELAKVYNLTKLFIYPSFYEGFGLPVAEAMACGTPVITSNVSSLPEVGGDAVVYVDPNDIEDIKQKIMMVLNDEDLQKQMIQKGLKRAKEFTWEKSAKKHMEVFYKVLNENSNNP